MMREKFTVKQMAENRSFYYCTEKNEKGEKLTVELVKIIDDLKDRKSFMNLWKKEGYIKEVLPSRWSIHTYVDDSDGNCRGAYNPMHKLSDDGKRYVINFEWMFEATEENKEKLLEEVYKRFMNELDHLAA